MVIICSISLKVLTKQRAQRREQRPYDRKPDKRRLKLDGGRIGGHSVASEGAEQTRKNTVLLALDRVARGLFILK